MAVALVLVGTLAFFAVGTTAYRAGMARGVAESGKLVGPGAGSPGQFMHPYPPHYWGPPHGFGFGFLIPLLFLFLLFGMFGAFGRRRFGHGHGPGPGYGYGYGPGGHGCGPGRGWEGGVPPAFEEWHKRAHEPKTEPAQKA